MPAPSGDAAGLPDPDLPGLIPDDASALEPDRLAWLAEVRRRRWQRRLRRIALPGAGDRLRPPGLVAALFLVTSFTLALFAVAGGPHHRGTPPGAAPLASVPPLDVPSDPATGTGPLPDRPEPTGTGPAWATLNGSGARRLPQLVLHGDAGEIAAAALRPALIALVPDGCRCEGALQAGHRQAREFQLDLWLVNADPATDDTAAALGRADDDSSGGAARWAVDPQAALARSVHSQGLTAVAVRADGVVSAVWRGLPATGAQLPALEPVLATLARPR